MGILSKKRDLMNPLFHEPREDGVEWHFSGITNKKIPYAARTGLQSKNDRDYPQINIPKMIAKRMIVIIVPTAAVDSSKKLSGITNVFPNV